MFWQKRSKVQEPKFANHQHNGQSTKDDSKMNRKFQTLKEFEIITDRLSSYLKILLFFKPYPRVGQCRYSDNDIYQ